MPTTAYDLLRTRASAKVGSEMIKYIERAVKIDETDWYSYLNLGIAHDELVMPTRRLPIGQ